MDCAEKSAVPAGGALAVDREEFSRLATQAIESQPLITVRREEACAHSPGAGDCGHRAFDKPALVGRNPETCAGAV